MRQIPFVKLASFEEQRIFARLNTCLRSRSVVPLLGAYGSGKSRLLTHLATEKLEHIGSNHVASVRLMKHRKTERGINSSNVARTLFSRLQHVLSVLSVMPRRTWEDTQKQDAVQDVSDAKMPQIFDDVTKNIRKQNIRALVLENAQHADDNALEWAMRLWEECNEQFGIVYCVRMEKDATEQEMLARVFNRVPMARDACTDIVTMPAMTDNDFKKAVLPDIQHGLDASLSAEARRQQADYISQALDYSQHNWRRIAQFITVLDEEIGPSDRSPRLITPEVIQRTFERLHNIRQRVTIEE
jgi:type II secretory pathway predicted ATPase ExeA